MTGKQLYTQLTESGNIDVDEATVAGWIHLAQREVSFDLPVRQSITITVTAGGIITIPTGVLKLVSATLGDGTIYPLSNITIPTDTTLLFAVAGTITLNYTSISPDYTDLKNELSIHPAVQSAIYFFLLSQYYNADGEGDSEESSVASTYYQQWAYLKNLAIETIKNSDNSINSMDPVETTDVMPHSRRRIGDSFYE